MKERFFTGVSTALVTPFKDGKLDLKSFSKLIRWQLDQGVQGIVICGSTGEAATLSKQEKLQIVEFGLSEVAGAVPVLAGCGTFNTAETVDLAKSFEKLKVTGLLVVTPYYNKPPQRGLVLHFTEVARAVKCPIILYNVPSRTSMTMTVETCFKIATQNENVVGVKEAAGSLEVMGQYVKSAPKNFSVLSGDDATFAQAICEGAHGVISVVSHLIPKACVEVSRPGRSTQEVEKFLKGYLNLINGIYVESNPIPVKWALKEMGIIESSELRLPLVDLDYIHHKTLREQLIQAGVIH
ncbi:MAG: 4-hydroxy-tetrahydrodipicolinate synthase [Oligoflexia bacterium]|nr:4-hydroxy-tetrahydrodipicolinate synthase [Oligoflexia bacterium]